MKRCALIVATEIGSLTLMGIVFERGGYSVLKARGPEEIFAILDENTPDVIVLDITAPYSGGIELCKIIRQREDSSIVPILILSSRGDAESIMRGMDAGANDYLPKPIVHNLVGKVNSILDEMDHDK